MKLNNGRLELSRELSALDEDVLKFTSILESHGVRYVIISGYVAILTGRSRSTEDVDIVLERLSEEQTERLATALQNDGYWGMAMPLDRMYEILSDNDRMRIAEEGAIYPNFEIWFVSNAVERKALVEAITADFDDGQIAISPIELQIAYELRLAQHADGVTGKDFEDALHLYLTFEEQFNTPQLELYVEELGVKEYYAELRGV